MSKKTLEEESGLTEEQLKKLKHEIQDSLSRNRHKLLVDMPFIGNIAMHFDLIPVRDKRCLTACCDGKNIYWSCDFYSKLNDKERVFVLAHEVFHAILLHFSRKQTRDQELFNVATDMEVNNALMEGSSDKSYEPPAQVLFPPEKLKGKSAEVIYDWLLKQQQKNNLNKAIQQAQQSRQSSRGYGGYGSQGQSDDDDQQQNGNQSQSKNGKGSQKGGSSGNGGGEKRDQSQDGKHDGSLKGQFDKHTYENDPTDDTQQQNAQQGQNGKNGKSGAKDKNGKDKDGKGGSSSGNGNEVRDQWGTVGYDPDFAPQVAQGAAERMREAVIAAAQTYEREHGNLPAGLSGIVDKLARPAIDWKTKLCQFVSKQMGVGRRSWLPPNRRHVYNDMYFQSRRSEVVNGVVCIDTSGSCIGDLPQFFGELKGLIESFGAYRIVVIQADAAVDKVDVYTPDENPLEFDSMEDIEVCGFGGTCYDPPFKYIEENNLNPDFVIYCGDGYADFSTPKPDYPVMWVITKDGTFDFCDWGEKIRLTDAQFD